MATKPGLAELLKIDDLLLDSKNPRIPESKQGLSQDDLAVFVADTYNAIAVAESIAAHEYFASEPLIAIKSGSKFTVVEGNRRLAALRLLRSPQLREKLADRSDWDKIKLAKVPSEVPVIVAKNRKEVAPIIGFRHISGIQPWDAYSKARYIASQVEAGLGFEKTARDVGEKTAEVRANYRNYKIAEQAKKLLDDETLTEMLDSFGVFNRAMQSTHLRNFVGAPAPEAVAAGKNPIPAGKRDALKEMIGFLFGPDSVIDESRQITTLGKVLASPDGLKVLRAQRNLEEAHFASGGLRERLVNRLGGAGRNLRAAKDDMPKYKKDRKVGELIDECVEALDDLVQIRK